MFKAYRFFKPLLWIFLFALAPLQSMETNNEVVTQFFDAVIACDVNTVRTILTNNPAIANAINPYENLTALQEAITFNQFSAQANNNKPEIVQLLLQSGAHTENLNVIALVFSVDNDDRAIQIIHLLFSSGLAIDSGDDQPYKEDRNSILQRWEGLTDNEEVLNLVKAHIHTRLYKAIEEGNVDEVRRLVQKYNIDINTVLPSYSTFGYGTPPLFIYLPGVKPANRNGLPLHLAAMHKQDAIVRLLVDEFDANVNIQDEYYSTALHHETHFEIAQFLISKGANLNILDNSGETPLDKIQWFFTPDGLNEIQDPERIENFHALKATFEGRHYVPGNSTFPWKLIGGGVAVVIVSVAAKKLYNWWYTPSEAQEEENKSEAQDEQQPVADVHA